MTRFAQVAAVLLTVGLGASGCVLRARPLVHPHHVKAHVHHASCGHHHHVKAVVVVKK